MSYFIQFYGSPDNQGDIQRFEIFKSKVEELIEKKGDIEVDFLYYDQSFTTQSDDARILFQPRRLKLSEIITTLNEQFRPSD